MPTPLPDPDAPTLGPPGRDEVVHITRGLKTAMQPEGGLTELQSQVLAAITASMTGYELDVDELEPLGPVEFAEGLAGRDLRFRTEMTQLMELGHMILDAPDLTVADRIVSYAAELDLDTGPLQKARALATGSAQLVAADKGNLAKHGTPERLADAFRRGALGTGSVDYIALDYFSMADRPIDDVRRDFGITPKSDAAVAAGSRGPFEPGGISGSQIEAGRYMADSRGRPYDAHGALG